MSDVKNILEVDDRTSYSSIIKQIDPDIFIGNATNPGVKTVTPKQGFCMKTKDGSGGKVFVNICHSDELPAPRDIGEEELMFILESDNPSDYKVPMSLGEARPGNDKTGKPCVIYDVVVNADFFSKILSSELFKTFVMTACLEGLEDKHCTQLDKNEWVVLRNKKYFGEMQSVTVRDQRKSFITEISGLIPNKASLDERTVVDDRHRRPHCKAEMPRFSLKKVSSSGGKRSECVAEIRLPKLEKSNVLRLSVGEDRLKLTTTTGIYHLDILLPIDVAEEDTTAEFHLDSKILVVKMPVAYCTSLGTSDRY